MHGVYRSAALLAVGGLVGAMGALISTWTNSPPPPARVVVATQPPGATTTPSDFAPPRAAEPVVPLPSDLIPRTTVPAVPFAPPLPAPEPGFSSPAIRVEPVAPVVPTPTPPAKPKSPPPARSAVRFVEPVGMLVSWQADGDAFHDRDLTAPAIYNFTQGRTYRLRLTNIARQPGRVFYPTLEVAPVSGATETFLAHCTVPVSFGEAELALAAEGQLVLKAVYLPRASQSRTNEPSVPVVEEASSAKLGPRADVVQRAKEMGDVLAVVRLGNVDLENPHSPPLSAPPAKADVPPAAAEPAPRPRAVPAASE